MRKKAEITEKKKNRDPCVEKNLFTKKQKTCVK